MNSQSSRKIIVAGGMAVVVIIGVVAFALRSHPVAPVPQTFQAPSPTAQTPDAPAAVAQTPAAPAQVAQLPGAPAAVGHDDSGAKSIDTAAPPAVEPKLVRNRKLTSADTGALAPKTIATRTGSAAETSEKPATETAANGVGQVQSADEVTPPLTTSNSPTDDQRVGNSNALAASDSQITTDVKAKIAGDSSSKDGNIGVTTTHGVVVLTGSLASQEAIDHVKVVAAEVQDVKSVDTSALVLASL